MRRTDLVVAGFEDGRMPRAKECGPLETGKGKGTCSLRPVKPLDFSPPEL